MSQIRQPRRLTAEQEPFLVIRSFATDYANGHVLETHVHSWHQLLYATSGAMTLFADCSSWLVPPGRAVFIAADCPHSIRMWGTVSMRSVYLSPPLLAPPGDGRRCRVLSVTPLLRELILRIVDLAALDSRNAADARLSEVLLDEMHEARVMPLILALPSEPRALDVARRLLDKPAESLTLEQVARAHGIGGRTLERVFRDETGMSFGLWRRKARLLASVRVLVETRSVTDAALESGYESVSAFIAAFKQAFGCTPGAMLATERQSA
jgi:AraC-like DNA-binding protein